MSTSGVHLQRFPSQPGTALIQLFSADWLEANQLREILLIAGFAVELIRGSGATLTNLSNVSAAGAIVDISIGREDALASLRKLRADGWKTPVMLLSCRSDMDSVVEGIDAGADHYVGRPFAEKELLSRTRALARRGIDASAASLRCGDLVLNSITRQVYRAGQLVDLTKREFELLFHLMSLPGQVCNRESILQRVWSGQMAPRTNIVDVYVRKLRDKIGDVKGQRLIHSIRGTGYMIKKSRDGSLSQNERMP